MKLRKVLLSAAVAAIPVNVLALGLGNAELSSALNEPLQARIQLFSAQNTDLEDIKAGLASTSEFQKAGLEWTRNLSELRFKVVAGPGGKPYISVTSKQPVREPFLNFLIEVNWPAGRLLREYTVLLDPPVYGAAMEKVVRPSVTTAPDESQQTVVGVPPPIPRTVSSATPRSAPSAGAAAGSMSEGQYGPVKRNDTLWSIATAVRPDGSVSVQQTMLALVEANPEAFIDGNVNALKEGYVLRIPRREEIAGRTQREALAEVKRQYELWQEQRLGTTAARAPEGGETAMAGGQPEAMTEQARLKLVSPGSGERGAGAGGTKALQESLALAEEERDSFKSENAELKSRVSETESMLEDFQRLLKLKDENIAALQRRLREQQAMAGEEAPVKGMAAPGPEAKPEGDTVPDVESLLPPAEGEMETGVDEELRAILGVPEGEEPELPGVAEEPMPSAEEPMPSEEAPAAMEEKPAPEPESAPAEEAPPAPPKRAPILPPPAAPEPAGLLDSLPVSPAILGAGLGGLVLLLVGGLLLRKKRAAEAGDEAPLAEEPIAAEAVAEPEMPAEDTDATAEFGPGEVQEKKPAEDERTSPEAFSDTMIQDAAAREDDALDEVNVYLAYERYDQAEQLVRKAIAAHPENEAYHLKLLEIHHTAKNAEGFKKDAVPLKELVGAGAPAMAQVIGWWEEIAPGDALFEEEGATTATEFEKTMGSAQPPSGAGDLDFDLTDDEDAVAAAEDAASGDEAVAEGDMDLDFDLGLEGDEASETAERAATDDLDLDLELEEGGEGDDTGESAVDTDMDLDFDLGEASEEPAEKPEAGELDLDIGGTREGEQPSDGGLDFDLGEGAGESEEKETPVAQSEESESAEGLDFDLSEGESAEEPEESAELDFDLGEGEGEGPEATTQDEMDIDFDLGEAEDEKTDDIGETGGEEDSESAIDFDIEGDEETNSEEMPTLEEEPPSSERLDTVALDNLDMDLDSGTGERAVNSGDAESGVDLDLGGDEAETPSTSDGDEGGDLDLDFSSFEESEDAGASAQAAGGEEAGKEDGEGPEIDFDLDLGFDDDDEPERTLALGKEMEGDLDEVGTKLDLAQAYIDMGNADGARTILNEVLSEGDEQQKVEAQQLMDKLE